MNDNWAKGDAYETYMGRWSRALARSFVEWLSPLPGARWIDVGCGTGALAGAICDVAAPASVLACDPSEPFIAYAKTRLLDGRVSFVAAAMDDVAQPNAGADYLVSGLVLNFLPDPRRSLQSMCDRVRRSGTVAAYVWDYLNGPEFLRCFWDEATKVDPRAVPLDEGRRFPICTPENLRALFVESGLLAADVAPLQIDTVFQGFDDFWLPFMRGTGPAPAYASSLPEDRQALLRGRLLSRLQPSADGAIRLKARAWAVRGIKP